jgi:hypothetical protein
VRQLYRAGAAPPEIAGAVARAIPDEVVGSLASPRLCSVEPIVARVAGAGCYDVLEAIEDERVVGHTVVEELARTAAVRTALIAGVTDPRPDWLTHVRAFACECLAAAFEYFVARDIVDYVGTEALPDVAAMASVIEAVAQEARAAGRDAAASPFASPEVPEALTPAVRARAVAAVMTGAFAILRRRGLADA